jgi:phosphonate transport system substrate-binding protein
MKNIGTKLIPFMMMISMVLSLVPAKVPAQPAHKTMSLTIIPHRSNLGNEQAYAPFIQYLENKTGIHFKWIGSKTYSDVIDKLKTRKADIGYMGPFAYVEAQDDFGVRIICRTLSKDSVEFYHSMIITRVDSGSNTLEDLKGKSFAFTDPKSTSGFLFPMAQLLKSGIRLEDFSKVDYVKRHANSLLAVYHGHSHAGATSFTAKDKVDINFSEIKVLWKSKPIYRGPWVAVKGMADKDFNAIQKAMLSIGRDEHAQQIFEGLTTKGFIKGKDSDYDNVREVKKLIKTSE